jgi:hypothetical protein
LESRLGLEKKIDEIAFHLKYGTSVTDSDDNNNGYSDKGEPDATEEDS